MFTLVLFTGLILLLTFGFPVAVAVGLPSALALYFSGLGVGSIANSIYTGIAKYPMLAVPMFVLAGILFERSGAVGRILKLVSVVTNRFPNSLGIFVIGLTMMIGGVTGSTNAGAAAVMVMVLTAMTRNGYPKPLTAAIVGSAATTEILIPPSLTLIMYSIFVPEVTVPALFAAGMVPGIIMGIGIMVPTYFLAVWYRDQQPVDAKPVKHPPIGKVLLDAGWGLMAPVLILGGMRLGWFTPTEAAVVAAAYCAFLGLVVFREMNLRDFVDAAISASETTAVIMIIVAMATTFSWAGSTLGVFDPIVNGILSVGIPWLILALVLLLLLVAGTLLDGTTIILVIVPILLPVARSLDWNLVWFGIIVTVCVGIGQVTPPVGMNLMITSRLANVPFNSTFTYVKWLLIGMLIAALIMVLEPETVLWLPRYFEYI